MHKKLVQEKTKINMNIPLLCQFIASLSWFASVIAYGSFELGDCLQLVAASAWTISNIINYHSV